MGLKSYFEGFKGGGIYYIITPYIRMLNSDYIHVAKKERRIIIIIIRRRNGAKTISLQTLFGRLNYCILVACLIKEFKTENEPTHDLPCMFLHSDTLF
jgi:hypothetical protein